MRWLNWKRHVVAAALAVSLVCVTSFARPVSTLKPSAQSTGPSSLKLVLHDDFERSSLTGWAFTDPNAWRMTRLDPEKNGVLELFQQSKYEPPVRSPFNIALAKDLDLTDVVIDLKVRSTTRDYGHRDICLVFGHQDSSHFYYVHLGKAADEHANSIFIVNGKPRVSIAESRTKGTPWTDGWHKVRLLRHVQDGLIQVFFDDMAHPAMVAHDKTFKHGRVGLGSFDDTGMFDDLELRGELHAASEKP
jgi:hypothetical protein